MRIPISGASVCFGSHEFLELSHQGLSSPSSIHHITNEANPSQESEVGSSGQHSTPVARKKPMWLCQSPDVQL